MSIKKYFTKKLCLKIYNDLDFDHYYKGTVKRILGTKITHTSSFLNQKCHQVSCDLYKANSDNKVVMAWCTDDEATTGFVHFLNYNKKDKVYIDNTLGGESIHSVYFILNSKWVQRSADDEIPNPSKWLINFRKDMYLKYCTSWLWKLFVKETDI